jgi:hypothetical protein
MLTRILPLVNVDGSHLRAIDDTTARQLLKKKLAIPVWGDRRIIALKIADPAWFDFDAPARTALPVGRAEALITEDGARWPSIFSDPMKPSKFTILPALWPLVAESPKTLRKVFVLPRKPRISSGLRLAA